MCGSTLYGIEKMIKTYFTKNFNMLIQFYPVQTIGTLFSGGLTPGSCGSAVDGVSFKQVGCGGRVLTPKPKFFCFFSSANVLREFCEIFAEEFCNFDGRSVLLTLGISTMI